MKSEHCHVFLSHNRADKPAVAELARRLSEAGLEPWLDDWNLIPGEPWQEAIEQALSQCRTCAVFVGPDGSGPWHNEEMRTAIDRRVRDGHREFRVIPVLLPGARRGERSSLPAFLQTTTWVEFHDTLDDERAFHRLMSGIRGQPPGPGQVVDAGETPYRGLYAFDENHAPFFFGREALTEWLLDKLQPARPDHPHARFLALVGPSGSGKSSLARAGLLAALHRDAIPGSANWPIVTCRPGRDPIEDLAVAICSLNRNGHHVPSVRELMHDLQEDDRSLHVTIRLALHDQPEDQRLLLLIDQFEDIFTRCDGEQLREAFLANLLYAASVPDGRVVVVMTLRADFYGRCAAYPALAAALADRQELVGPMSADELRQAIERPAQLVGCELEPGLVELLLAEMHDQPGSLPLLQHALFELWRRRSGRRLTIEAYRAIGGVSGALHRRADEVYHSLIPEEQAICRHIFLRLVQPRAHAGAFRRRVAVSEVLPAQETSDESAPDGASARKRDASPTEAVIDTLVSERLITITGMGVGEGDGAAPSSERFIELAHEALINGWDKLKTWIREDREALRVHRRLTAAAGEWIDHGYRDDMLYRDFRLAEVQHHAARLTLSQDERDFIAASSRAAAARERRRYLGQAAGGAVGAALGYGLLIALPTVLVSLEQGDALLVALRTAFFAFSGLLLPGGLVGLCIGLALWVRRQHGWATLFVSILTGAVASGIAFSVFRLLNRSTTTLVDIAANALIGAGIGVGIGLPYHRLRLIGAPLGATLGVLLAVRLGALDLQHPLMIPVTGCLLGGLTALGFAVTAVEPDSVQPSAFSHQPAPPE